MVVAEKPELEIMITDAGNSVPVKSITLRNLFCGYLGVLQAGAVVERKTSWERLFK